MSEIHPTYPMKIAEAYKHNNEQMNRDMQRFHDWVGPAGEVSQEAADDMVEYLKSRPFEDNNGVVREANGRFVRSAETYSNGNVKKDVTEKIFGLDDRKHYDSTHQAGHSELGLKELISAWAEAERGDDKTAANDIQDVIMSRVLETENLDDDQKDRLLSRIVKQKDAQKNKSSNNVTEPSNKSDSVGDEINKLQSAMEDAKKARENGDRSAYHKALGYMADAADKIEQNQGKKLDEIAPGVTEYIDSQLGNISASKVDESDDDAAEAARRQEILDANGTLDGVTPKRRGKIRESIRNMRNRTLATAGAVAGGTLPERVSDRERMGRGKKLVLAGLGAAALGTMAYLAYRGMNNGGGSGAAREAGERGAGAAARNAEKAQNIIDQMTPKERKNLQQMVNWEQNWIQDKGLDPEDPKSWSKAAKAFKRGITYMGKVKAARSGGDLPHTL